MNRIVLLRIESKRFEVIGTDSPSTFERRPNVRGIKGI